MMLQPGSAQSLIGAVTPAMTGRIMAAGPARPALFPARSGGIRLKVSWTVAPSRADDYRLDGPARPAARRGDYRTDARTMARVRDALRPERPGFEPRRDDRPATALERDGFRPDRTGADIGPDAYVDDGRGAASDRHGFRSERASLEPERPSWDLDRSDGSAFGRGYSPPDRPRALYADSPLDRPRRPHADGPLDRPRGLHPDGPLDQPRGLQGEAGRAVPGRCPSEPATAAIRSGQAATVPGLVGTESAPFPVIGTRTGRRRQRRATAMTTR